MQKTNSQQRGAVMPWSLVWLLLMLEWCNQALPILLQGLRHCGAHTCGCVDGELGAGCRCWGYIISVANVADGSKQDNGY
eukprot:1358236-Pleurochrysis_carterae.AAC.2